MSQRLVAIIDADVQFAGHLQDELRRHGVAVEATVDSNELMARKDGLPDLVVLCIDPKRTGWAVCNRLRKSPLLKSIPLIITSAEATEKDFDDHKKLKTRAEEYLHKPFNADALVGKIATLIQLPQAAPAEIEVEPESAEIDIEPESIGAVEAFGESTGTGFDGATATFESQPGEDESTRIGFTSEIDGEVDLETNAAFAAIGLEETADPARTASPFDDDPFSLPAPPPVQAAPPKPAPIAKAPADLDSVPVPRLSAEELGIGLEEVQRDAAALVASTPPPPVRAPAPDTSAQALEEARREIDRLKRENEELRAKPKAEPAPAVTSFSREREFLTLRETINKKEKDVLDLKDALDSKERQILDGKDKLRDAERKLREVEERSLGTERDHVAAKEKIEALSNDKERSVEREKQTKGRLEDTQKALQRTETELEDWRTKHATETSALDEKLNQTVASHREELTNLRQAQTDAEARLKAENAAAVASLRSEHATTLSTERQAREEEKQGLLEVHASELAAAKDEHAMQVAQLTDDHAAQVARSKADHAAQVARMTSDHEDLVTGLRERNEQDRTTRDAEHRASLESELKAAERRQGEAIVDLETKHEAMLRDTTQRHQAALAAANEEARRTLEQAVADHLTERQRQEADHARAIETLDTKHADALATAAEDAQAAMASALQQRGVEHETELKSLRDQGQRKLQALEESHADLKAGMAARHATQVDDLRKQYAATVAEHNAAIGERDALIAQHVEKHTELEDALAAEQTQGQSHVRQIDDLESALEAARAEAETRNKTLSERAARIAELEQESARYQDQVLRAYQRIKSDENIVARAKKALAIALTLLEESAPENENASS